jgi:hypothetical protein
VAERPAVFDLASHGGGQGGVVPRLVHEGARAAAHRLDRCVDAAPAGHDDDGEQRILLAHFLEQLESFTSGRRIAGVVEVHQQQIVGAAIETGTHLLHRAGGVGLEAGIAKQEPQRGDHVGLVVGHEHARDAASAVKGLPEARRSWRHATPGIKARAESC